uniref:histone H1-like n=1 Tax=Euleptes europaea TaxID=460621 RepID=UPI002541DFDC|nr:histone H1-like [Euleptes europaea]
MVHRKQPGGALLSEEGTSSAALSSPPKRRSRASFKATKLPYSLSQLILQAVETCSARKGLSLAALKKHLAETGYNVHKNNSRLKRELTNLVSHGLLTRVSGTTGATGSFKRSRPRKKTGKPEPEKKKAVVAKKSPRANKEPHKQQQQPVNKPKNLHRQSTANAGGKKNQLKNHPAGSNRNVPAKGARRKSTPRLDFTVKYPSAGTAAFKFLRHSVKAEAAPSDAQ